MTSLRWPNLFFNSSRKKFLWEFATTQLTYYSGMFWWSKLLWYLLPRAGDRLDGGWGSQDVSHCSCIRNTLTYWNLGRSSRSCDRSCTAPCTADWSLTGSDEMTWKEFFPRPVHHNLTLIDLEDESRESSQSELDIQDIALYFALRKKSAML